MEKRYYYTYPLAAAWMAKHYGMNLQIHHSYEGEDFGLLTVTALQAGTLYDGTAHYVEATNENDDFAFGGEDPNDRFSGVFYIHPDSMHLLEPNEGDMICVAAPDKDFFTRILKRYNTREVSIESGWVTRRNIIELDEVRRIVQRNGKPFFWPDGERN